jgi:hypothetical protein
MGTSYAPLFALEYNINDNIAKLNSFYALTEEISIIWRRKNYLGALLIIVTSTT